MAARFKRNKRTWKKMLQMSNNIKVGKLEIEKPLFIKREIRRIQKDEKIRSFDEINPFDIRLAVSQAIKKQYSNRVPVILQPSKHMVDTTMHFFAPIRLLVPDNISIGIFFNEIGNCFIRDKHNHLCFHLTHNKGVSLDTPIGKIEKYPDGFLYVNAEIDLQFLKDSGFTIYTKK